MKITGEKFYNLIPQRIIAEKYLFNTSNEHLREYKILNFGKSNRKIIALAAGRENNSDAPPLFYDENWIKLPVSAGNDVDLSEFHLEKPDNLNEILEIASKLAGEIDFIRVDLYVAENRIYFGGLTNSPGRGLNHFYPQTWDLLLGNLWRGVDVPVL